MFELTNADAGDIAVTAAEGGIGYWSQIAVYQPSRWFTGDGIHPDSVPDDFVFYHIAESYFGTDGYAWDDSGLCHAITPAVIRRGWNRLVERWEKRSLNPYGFDPRDLGSVDSNVADLIVQLGLFDKVEYG